MVVSPQGTAASSAIMNPQLAGLAGQPPRQSFIYTPPEAKPRAQAPRQPVEGRRSNPSENGGVPKPPQQEGPKMVSGVCSLCVCVVAVQM